MIYLASPYSHSDPLIMKTRFLLAEQATAGLLAQGLYPYSPIVHCHELAIKYNLPTSFSFWKAYNFDMLRRADSFGILSIDGWNKSEGLLAEHKMATELGIRVHIVNAAGEIIDGSDNSDSRLDPLFNSKDVSGRSGLDL